MIHTPRSLAVRVTAGILTGILALLITLTLLLATCSVVAVIL